VTALETADARFGTTALIIAEAEFVLND